MRPALRLPVMGGVEDVAHIEQHADSVAARQARSPSHRTCDTLLPCNAKCREPKGTGYVGRGGETEPIFRV